MLWSSETLLIPAPPLLADGKLINVLMIAIFVTCAFSGKNTDRSFFSMPAHVHGMTEFYPAPKNASDAVCCVALSTFCNPKYVAHIF